MACIRNYNDYNFNFDESSEASTDDFRLPGYTVYSVLNLAMSCTLSQINDDDNDDIYNIYSKEYGLD